MYRFLRLMFELETLKKNIISLALYIYVPYIKCSQLYK